MLTEVALMIAGGLLVVGGVALGLLAGASSRGGHRPTLPPNPLPPPPLPRYITRKDETTTYKPTRPYPTTPPPWGPGGPVDVDLARVSPPPAPTGACPPHCENGRAS